MFVDQVKITAKAGNGGNGAVSFHREKFVQNGGPDGGDGGNGGDIVLLADPNMHTLMDFRYKRKYTADNGENGAAALCRGKSAKDLIIKVPVGTTVRLVSDGRLVADMHEAGQEHILLKGGRGGWGNAHFATPTRQAPNFAKPGQKCEITEFELELKSIADVGLVGYPNVGKSTILSVVTAARPKIANYHFTTLAPNLGICRQYGTDFVMADIPGLVEGASDGVGLGHEFLRHVERCRLIVHVVDVSGIEGRDPKDDFEKINKELANFSEELAASPQIVAGNKCDMADEAQIEDFRSYIESKGLSFFPISAATTAGTDALMDCVAAELEKLPPAKRFEVQPLTLEELTDIESKKHSFTIEKVDGVYVVDAEFLAPILSTVNMEDYESLQYFQRVLRYSGIIDELERMGIQEDDLVSIYDFEFNYVR